MEKWEAGALEDALAEANMCAGMVRSPEEWRAHPQGQAVASQPLFQIDRIGDAPAAPLSGGHPPLDGVWVLDLTRVTAVPVCGRSLAEPGADVLPVSWPTLPLLPTLVQCT